MVSLDDPEKNRAFAKELEARHVLLSDPGGEVARAYGVTALGGLYFLLPRITGKPLYSRFLADLQYWLVLIGITGFAIVLTIVGLIQGNAWYNGETLYRTLPEIQPYYVLRASLGAFIMIGAYLGLYNIIRTIYFNRGTTT